MIFLWVLWHGKCPTSFLVPLRFCNFLGMRVWMRIDNFQICTDPPCHSNDSFPGKAQPNSSLIIMTLNFSGCGRCQKLQGSPIINKHHRDQVTPDHADQPIGTSILEPRNRCRFVSTLFSIFSMLSTLIKQDPMCMRCLICDSSHLWEPMYAVALMIPISKIMSRGY